MMDTRERLSSTEMLVKGKCMSVISGTYEDQNNYQNHGGMNIIR